MSPQLILKCLISSVVSLAQLVSPSVALPAELVIKCSKADEKGLDERIIRENKMLIRLVKKKKKIRKKQSSQKNKVKKRKGKKRKTERKRKGAKYQRTVELIN